MKRKMHWVEQIIAAVKQHELGTPTADIARQLGIQAVFSHHPCHPLMSDDIAAMPDLSHHTAVVVARELVINRFV